MNALQMLCAELDLTVLRKAVTEEGGARVRLFAVGCETDRRAGINGSVITPWFTTTRGLVAHCEADYEQIIEKGAPEC